MRRAGFFDSLLVLDLAEAFVRVAAETAPREFLARVVVVLPCPVELSALLLGLGEVEEKDHMGGPVA